MEKLLDLRDAMPRHWSLCFMVLRVLRIWESVFYSQAFFTLHSFLLFLRLPWDRQFNLKASRASSWSLRHSPSSAICLNHNNPQKRYRGKFYLWFTAGWLCEESAPHTIRTLFTTSRKSQMAYLFGNRAIQSEINGAKYYYSWFGIHVIMFSTTKKYQYFWCFNIHTSMHG